MFSDPGKLVWCLEGFVGVPLEFQELVVQRIHHSPGMPMLLLDGDGGKHTSTQFSLSHPLHGALL